MRNCDNKISEIRNVLDHGFVELVGHYGSDSMIARTARESRGITKPSASDANEKLIREMIDKGHETPFRFASVHYRIKWPVFVARQAMRHNVGVSWIEKSLRYTKRKPEFYVPLGLVNSRLIDVYNEAEFTYQKLLEDGVEPEIARLSLPLGTYTQCQVIFTLQALIHFLKLRLDHHAQNEIRLYADAMKHLAEPYFPVSIITFLKNGV